MKKRFILICIVVLIADVSSRSKADPPPDSTMVIHAIGTLEPGESADVLAPVSGTVLKLGSDPDDSSKTISFRTIVKKGTVLAELDPAPFKAAVDQDTADLQHAEAELRLSNKKVLLAQRELDLAKKHVADKTADQLDLDVAQATLDVAQATVELDEATLAQSKSAAQNAKLNLSNCTIISPIDGTIIDVRCHAGEGVTPAPDKPYLFLIGNLKRMQIWADIKEADITKVSKGQAVQFTTDAFPSVKFKGQVDKVQLNAVAIQRAVTYTVEIDVDNTDGKLLPYLTANVSIDISRH